MREEPGARRAGLSREQIGETALEIADADGFDELSMRRIARELGAGTMSLYHYVRSKDELLALMWDVVIGELIVPDDELSGDWRDALSKLARATRRAFKNHPWIFEAMGEPAQSGPSGLKHFEQSLAAVSELRVPPRERLELVGARGRLRLRVHPPRGAPGELRRPGRSEHGRVGHGFLRVTARDRRVPQHQQALPR